MGRCGRASTAPRPSPHPSLDGLGQPALELGHVLRERGDDPLHVELLPKLRLDRLQRPLYGPGLDAEALLAPRPAEEDAEAPVPHAVPEEEVVALAQLVEDLHGDEALHRAAAEVADVVVL